MLLESQGESCQCCASCFHLRLNGFSNDEHGYRHVGHRIMERTMERRSGSSRSNYTRGTRDPIAFRNGCPVQLFHVDGNLPGRASISIISYTRDTRNCGSFFSFFLLFSLSVSFSLRPRFMSSSVRWQRFVIAVASTFVRQIGREGDTERRFASRSSSVSIFSLFFFFFFFFVLQISTSSEP